MRLIYAGFAYGLAIADPHMEFAAGNPPLGFAVHILSIFFRLKGMSAPIFFAQSRKSDCKYIRRIQ